MTKMEMAAPLADQMPRSSVRLAALAATLASQQVTQVRADALTGEPDALVHLAVRIKANELCAEERDDGHRKEIRSEDREDDAEPKWRKDVFADARQERHREKYDRGR